MTLSDYVSSKRLTGTEVATALQVSRSAVSLYLSGKRRPTDDVMRRIVRWSNGRVTANDFYDLVTHGGGGTARQRRRACTPDRRSRSVR